MERIDDLMRGGFRLIQDTELFCFGIDAVLLADFARARRGQRVMDLCAGTGVISLLMLARYPQALYEALEIQPGAYDLLLRNIALNQVTGRITPHRGDLRHIPSPEAFSPAAPPFPPGGFQVVTCNPPYQPLGSGRPIDENEALYIARHEVLCKFHDIAKAAAYLLCDHGRFYFIHRPERLEELFASLTRYRLTPKQLRMVHPSQGKAPTQVLVAAVKGAASGLKVHPPLYVYASPGVYTKEIEAIYGIHR